jgi:hypothetical protein
MKVGKARPTLLARALCRDQVRGRPSRIRVVTSGDLPSPGALDAGERQARSEVMSMETTKQVSVFLENKPGRLANVLSALAREKINITALTVMDSHEHSVLRVVTNDTTKTLQVLNAMSTPHAESDVVLVELRNQPGALARVCEQLAGEHINIDYCYCSSGGRNGRVVGIFKVSNTEKAARVLGEASPNANKRRNKVRPPRARQAYSPPANNSR